MGNPLDRSKRIFQQFVLSFSEAFPNVESVKIKYTTFDLLAKHSSGVWDFAQQGGQMRCPNYRCERGGFEFDNLVGDMVREGETWKDFELDCQGDEGSPTGRRKGRSCEMSVKGQIEVKYK
jgi:hypothetical protein